MKSLSSRFAVLAPCALVAAALLVVLAPRPARAQAGGEQPLTGNVSAQVAALQAALAELKDKVERLESERGRVKAPFTVVDDAGAALLTVGKEPSGNPYLAVGVEGQAGRALIRVSADGADLSLSSGGREIVTLQGRDNDAHIHVNDGQTEAVVGTHAEGRSGISVARAKGGGKVYLITTERSGEISLLDANGPIFSVQNQDSPRMTLSNAAGQPLFGVGTFEGKPVMTLREEGSGRIQIGIATQGNAPYVSLFDSTAERATIEGGATPAISLADAQGNDVFNVTGDSSPTLTLGRSNTARVALAGGGDAAYLSVFDATVERVGLYGGTDTRITLSNAEGEAILTGGGNPDVDKPVLVVGKPTGARVELGVTKDATGSFTRWLDGAGKFRAMTEGRTDYAVFSLRDTDGTEFFSAGMGTSFPAAIELGKGGQPRVVLGLTENDSYASFYGTAGLEPAASIKAGAARSMLELRDNNMFARVGTVDDTNSRLGLYLGKGDKTYLRANFGGVAGGGEFAASNDSGKPVAGLIAADTGGSLLVMGPQGGTVVAHVECTDHGGEVAVFATSGDRRGGLESSSTGEGVFSVMGPGGSVAMTSGQTAPRLVVEKEGQQFVYLGATTSGEGVVKAGPGGNGVAGTLGSGLTAASALQGKAQ